MSDKIHVGDTVRLKSGGPLLTVNETNYMEFYNNIECVWVDKLGMPHKVAYSDQALVKEEENKEV